jgi:hypothetical protein
MENKQRHDIDGCLLILPGCLRSLNILGNPNNDGCSQKSWRWRRQRYWNNNNNPLMSFSLSIFQKKILAVAAH